MAGHGHVVAIQGENLIADAQLSLGRGVPANTRDSVNCRAWRVLENKPKGDVWRAPGQGHRDARTRRGRSGSVLDPRLTGAL